MRRLSAIWTELARLTGYHGGYHGKIITDLRTALRCSDRIMARQVAQRAEHGVRQDVLAAFDDVAVFDAELAVQLG